MNVRGVIVATIRQRAHTSFCITWVVDAVARSCQWRLSLCGGRIPCLLSATLDMRYCQRGWLGSVRAAELSGKDFVTKYFTRATGPSEYKLMRTGGVGPALRGVCSLSYGEFYGI